MFHRSASTRSLAAGAALAQVIKAGNKKPAPISAGATTPLKAGDTTPKAKPTA